MSDKSMKLNLKVWRQKDPQSEGKMVSYALEGVSPDMSFLEMLDTLNEKLTREGQDPVAFDHDCREGICGSCGIVINGKAHGGLGKMTTCQLHMRKFSDGDSVTLEPWRAKAFPVVKDLVVNRAAFDRIIQAGGYVSVNTGAAVEGNTHPISKGAAEKAFDAATCIGCGACVAACKNASAMLFTSAKIAQFSYLPQGQVERGRRAQTMVAAMDAEAFGACTNEGECEAVCPKGISMKNITRMNREFVTSSFSSSPDID